jgi:hypothetical protein
MRSSGLRRVTSANGCFYSNYLDRNAIAQARLNNLEDDLGLVGNQFNVAVSILFVGYVDHQKPLYGKILTQIVIL